MLCRATQDDPRVMVESSEKMWSTGEGNGKPLQYSFLENPMNSMKRQKDKTLKEELPNISGEITSEKKKDGMEPKQKQHPVVDVIGDRSKVRCCKSNIT